MSMGLVGGKVGKADVQPGTAQTQLSDINNDSLRIGCDTCCQFNK
jgi:hypothetical protein